MSKITNIISNPTIEAKLTSGRREDTPYHQISHQSFRISHLTLRLSHFAFRNMPNCSGCLWTHFRGIDSIGLPLGGGIGEHLTRALCHEDATSFALQGITYKYDLSILMNCCRQIGVQTHFCVSQFDLFHVSLHLSIFSCLFASIVFSFLKISLPLYLPSIFLNLLVVSIPP